MMLSEMDIHEGTGHVTAKGKRTKRMRPWSPCAVAGTTMTSSSSSASGGTGADSSAVSDKEEEDMANCLILLAQGRGGETVIAQREKKQEAEIENHVGGDDNNKMMMMMTEKSTNKIGFYVYECKTCNRTFPSFQALGGHRASHKKPKVTVTQEEKKKPPPLPLPPPPPPTAPPPPLITRDFQETRQNHVKNIIVQHRVSLELGVNFHGNKSSNSKSKIHECSICGSEFTSGQALGGHMRRHRAVATATATVTATSTDNNSAAVQTTRDVKPRIVLELDLNLPAPEDDLRESAFQIPANQKSMVLSAAPALVGCHY